MITTLTLSPSADELTVTHSFGGSVSIRLTDASRHVAAVVSLHPDTAARLIHLLRTELEEYPEGRGAK